MARILGVEIPDHKRLLIALTSIHGIGRSTSKAILGQLEIDMDRKMEQLTPEEIKRIIHAISSSYKIEGALRGEKMLAIKKLMDMGCYVGKRHRESRPVRGQRTKTNCRTVKGPRKNAMKTRFKKR